MPKRQFGLIGYPLSHSFSKKYFAEKFQKENISDAEYHLYEIDKIEKVAEVFKVEGLTGFNITIPYKEAIKPYLDGLDHSAEKVGAINVVKIGPDGTKVGFNSDYYGFKTSLENWADLSLIKNALILGSGGASKAVKAALYDLNINFKIVSRSSTKGDINYDALNSDINYYKEHQLLINTTPLGTYPNTSLKPELKYEWLSSQHYLYDLVYNPEQTQFMLEGTKQGAHTKNGHEMLALQAEKSWEIWNS